MYAKKTTVINKTGLHARPASAFVSAASRFKADIKIKKLDANGEIVKTGPAKSIVYLLTMQLSRGTRIELFADGPDEVEAVDTLVGLIESGFDDL